MNAQMETTAGGPLDLPYITQERKASPAAAAVPGHETDLSFVDTEEPNDEEIASLRRVSDKIPWNIYTIAVIEAAERFSYYGCIAVFTNFVQKPRPAGSLTGAVPASDRNGDSSLDQAGALGLKQRASTGVTTFNTFWQYATPLLGAYVADTYLGRFKTISVALAIDILGHIILIVSALPPVLNKPHGSLAALILGIFTVGLGTGGFKPNVNTLIAEQMQSERMYKKTLKTGEVVIVDPAVTASRIYNWFYLFINIGALVGQIGMVYCEYYVGFWLSFTLPTIILCICPLILLWGRKRYRRTPPHGSVLDKSVRLFLLANKGRWSINPVRTYRNLHDGTFWASVKPSQFDDHERPKWMTFDDNWVEEVRRGFAACAVFLWYPLFWICYNQINNNLVSQAATMQRHGIPNDVISNLNPFALIIMIPILDRIVYPALRKMRINFTPVKKITTGYFVACAAMIWSCVIQYYIYKRSPCGEWANDCETPAPLNVWAQTGSYVLVAFAEIMANITSLEYAYSKAPVNMRSMVQSFALFMNAISSAIGFALVSLAEDPLLIWNYGVVAVLAFIGGCCFWLQFRKLDKEEDRLNRLQRGAYRTESSDDDNHEKAVI